MLGLLSGIPLGVKITFSLLGLALFLLHRFFTKHFNYWKDKGVIFDKPVPVFGTMASQMLLKEHAVHYAQKMYQKHEGQPFVGYFPGRTPALMIMDQEHIKNIFVKDFSHFVDHGFKIHEDADPLQARNLFNLNGQKWREVRNKLLPTFTSGKIKAMFPLMLECSQQFEEPLEKVAKNKEHFDAKDLMGCLFTDIIGSCIFGIKTNTIKNPDSQFRVMGKRLNEFNFIQAMKLMIILFLPEVAMKFKLAITENEVTDFFRKLVHDVMEQRKESKVVRKDFIQLLLELKEKGSVAMDVDLEEDKHLQSEIQDALKNKNSFYKLDDNDLAAQATVFFSAGFETSSTLLSYTLLELAVNPDVQRKAYLELDEALSQNNGVISYESLKQMKFLDCVLQETLRKYPPVPIHNRVCTKKYTFPGSNVTIDEGVMIAIPNHAIQMDPKYFSNPEMYDPERFSGEDALQKVAYQHTPFGQGPRQCIGNRFAMVQSKLALLTILRKYKVVQCPKTVYPVKFDVKQFILTPVDGIWLKLEHRK